MNPQTSPTESTALTRRQLLRQAGGGLGMLALGSLLDPSHASGADASPANLLAARAGHFPAKAKNVIWLFMNGGPSQVDTWDYKPELVKRNGEDCPDGFYKGKRFAFTSGRPKLMGTPRTFKQFGKGIVHDFALFVEGGCNGWHIAVKIFFFHGFIRY